MIKLSIVSGGFDPLHVGHLELFERAKSLAYRLFVIVNNDQFLIRKKGKPFMSFAERMRIVESIYCVDKVIPCADTDDTVCRTLKNIYKNQKTGEIILIINKYKTAGTYGKKTIIINNKRLAEEVSKLELKDGDALFKLDGKPASSKTIAQRVRRMTINKLSEGEVAKIIVKHMIDSKNFEELRRISRSRGTSMETLLSSYNIYDDK